MTDRPNSNMQPSRIFSARKLALMATVVAGLGAASYGLVPTFHSSDFLTTPAHAQVNKDVRQVQQPIGFADIVEKVKPSVISVRVKIPEKMSDNESFDDIPFPPGSPMERFFRRFGGPDGFPGRRGHGRHGGPVITGQGSGFFISADGYAVTNNHVVDGADKVEVTTDDGKTYKAKVIGTDKRTDLALIKVDGRTDFPFAKLSDKQPRIGDWVLAEMHEWIVNIHVQEITENGQDLAHFNAVHGVQGPPAGEMRIEGWTRRNTVVAEMVTPRGPMTGKIDVTATGPGQSISEFTDITHVVHSQQVTPIDAQTTHLRWQLYHAPGLSEGRLRVTGARIRDLVKQAFGLRTRAHDLDVTVANRAIDQPGADRVHPLDAGQVDRQRVGLRIDLSLDARRARNRQRSSDP